MLSARTGRLSLWLGGATLAFLLFIRITSGFKPPGEFAIGAVRYRFDSTKFAKEFGFAGTPYPEGIRIAVDSYKRKT